MGASHTFAALHVPPTARKPGAGKRGFHVWAGNLERRAVGRGARERGRGRERGCIRAGSESINARSEPESMNARSETAGPVRESIEIGSESASAEYCCQIRVQQPPRTRVYRNRIQVYRRRIRVNHRLPSPDPRLPAPDPAHRRRIRFYRRRIRAYRNRIRVYRRRIPVEVRGGQAPSRASSRVLDP